MNTIDINIWDDISEESTITNIRIETDFPLDLQKMCLEFLGAKIKSLEFSKNNNLNVELKFFDSTVEYPTLSEDVMKPYTLWELIISPVTYSLLNPLATELDNLQLTFNSSLLNIYSES